MEQSRTGAKELPSIPTLCYVIEQRERSSVSPTHHHEASMSWTCKKPRLARLLHKTKIMKRLGGLIFLFGIPFCLLGCILTILSYTNSATEEPGQLATFSIMGPALIVLAFLSFVLGCLLDGQYKESHLPTIGRLSCTNNFQNGGNITKDVSHFEKHKNGPRPQYNTLTHSKPQYNILNHLKQNNSSINGQDMQDTESVLNGISLKRRISNESTPSEIVIGTKSSNLKGILKKPSNWRSTFRSDKTMKTVDFALATTQEVDDSQLKKDVSSLTQKSVTIVGAGRILSAASLLLWAVSEKIKLIDPSITLGTFSAKRRLPCCYNSARLRAEYKERINEGKSERENCEQKQDENKRRAVVNDPLQL